MGKIMTRLSESLRTVIALAVQNNLKLHQMDVTTAFLNGELKEDVHIRQPEGYVVKGKENLVCRLKKSIFMDRSKVPDAGIQLQTIISKKMGFVQTPGDPCLYLVLEGETFLIAVYVDDILLAGKSDEQLTVVKHALSQQFKVKDMGELNYFLGVKIVQNYKTGSVWIGQDAYTENILKLFGCQTHSNTS